ncbi:MAG: hypothetical protein GY953_14150, partial [bacterium]|nr:hypothetical protein [bacterium]
MLLGLAVSSAAAQGRVYLPAELRRLVDLPTPAARRECADQLAALPEVSIDQWLTAMRRFGKFAAVEPGTTRQREDLLVGEVVEATELFVHVPETYAANKPAPLMLMLHGSGGNGRGLDRYWS